MTTIERVDRHIRVILCVCIGALLAPSLAWAGIEPHAVQDRPLRHRDGAGDPRGRAQRR